MFSYQKNFSFNAFVPPSQAGLFLRSELLEFAGLGVLGHEAGDLSRLARLTTIWHFQVNKNMWHVHM